MSEIRKINAGNVEIGGDRLAILAGPCALESLELGLETGAEMKRLCEKYGFGYVFKASYDKANRTSISSYRGPGLAKGLEQLAEIKERLDVPVVTDIHEAWQALLAGEVADIIQIPAFLCRQTDLLVAAAKTGKVVNIKKAQFMAPEDMKSAAAKCRETGNSDVMLCERGTEFGYHELSVDMRSLAVMRGLGCPVCFDATHSVQKPGGSGTSSGGDRRFVLPLIRAALAIGIDALFMEVHPDPANAKSDGANMIPLAKMDYVLSQIKEFDDTARRIGFAQLDWAEV